MKEIEVKILEINHQEMCNKLEALGAKKEFEMEVVSYVYDFPDKRLKDKKSFLRLRKKGNSNTLTFKQKISSDEAKIVDEYEVEVSDFEMARKIISELGMVEKQSFTKIRTRYVLENTLFELDKLLGEYSYIPEFMEIEGPDIQTIYKYAELLGYSKEDCKPWGGNKLVKHYQR